MKWIFVILKRIFAIQYRFLSIPNVRFWYFHANSFYELPAIFFIVTFTVLLLESAPLGKWSWVLYMDVSYRLMCIANLHWHQICYRHRREMFENGTKLTGEHFSSFASVFAYTDREFRLPLNFNCIYDNNIFTFFPYQFVHQCKCTSALSRTSDSLAHTPTIILYFFLALFDCWLTPVQTNIFIFICLFEKFYRYIYRQNGQWEQTHIHNTPGKNCINK